MLLGAGSLLLAITGDSSQPETSSKRNGQRADRYLARSMADRLEKELSRPVTKETEVGRRKSTVFDIHLGDCMMVMTTRTEGDGGRPRSKREVFMPLANLLVRPAKPNELVNNQFDTSRSIVIESAEGYFSAFDIAFSTEPQSPGDSMRPGARCFREECIVELELARVVFDGQGIRDDIIADLRRLSRICRGSL